MLTNLSSTNKGKEVSYNDLTSLKILIKELIQVSKQNSQILQNLTREISSLKNKDAFISSGDYMEKIKELKPVTPRIIHDLDDLKDSQKKVLHTLIDEFGGRASAQMLANKLGRERATISLYLNKLERKGLIGKEGGRRELRINGSLSKENDQEKLVENPKVTYFYIQDQSADERINSLLMEEGEEFKI